MGGDFCLNRTPRLLKAISYTVIAVAILALVYFLLFTPTGIKLTHTNLKQVSIYLNSHSRYAVVLGMLVVFIQTIVPIVPFVLVAGANVLAFGLVKGFLINYSMAILGAMVTFAFARNLGHNWAQAKIEKSPFFISLNQKMETHGFLYILMGRFIPVLPSTAINLGAGVFRVPFSHFLAATLIGKLPMVYLESTVAHDIMHIHQYRGRLLVTLAILIFLLVLGRYVKKKLTKPRG